MNISGISGFRLVFSAFALVACGVPSLAAATTAANGGDVRLLQTLPAALHPVLYRTLAKNMAPAYQIGKSGCARLPDSTLKACFDADGAHFRGVKEKPLALHLVAWGRGAKLSPTNPVRPEINGNQVHYRHGNLSEWWRALPIGFEQGFTLAKRPSGHGKLIFALATGDKASRYHDTLAWGKLRYGSLVVTDAKDKIIPATLKNEGNRILITVNDAHAVYPLTVDPLVWLEQKVSASDGFDYDDFGGSVALDGTTAIIGAGNPWGGAAYIFTESDGNWTQTAELTPSDRGAPVYFGSSVALSGTTALIGAPALDINVTPGAVYVFTESNGTWTQTQKFTASDGIKGDDFGYSIAFDAGTMIVGAPDAKLDNHHKGAAYIFTDSNGNWIQAQKLTASDGKFFGASVALNGTNALVGASDTVINGNDQQGAAYMFVQTDGTWAESQKLTAADGTAYDNFGTSVDLSGTTALIGAPGAVYAFDESNGMWTQAQKIVANDITGCDAFGRSISFHGTVALIGSPTSAPCSTDPDAAYVFTNSNGNWIQIQKFIAGINARGYRFGAAVALDGQTALVGAAAGGGINDDRGAAYFYGASKLSLAVNAPQTIAQGQNYVSQTIATNNAGESSPAVSATITVPAAASFVSAAATQGSCSENAGVVTCDFGSINGNAGTATANVTLKTTGSPGDTIENTASVVGATPPLTASAATVITQRSCPEGYTEYDGTLAPGQRVWSPPFQAPAGEENAILAAPLGFQLFAVLRRSGHGWAVYRIPNNEAHRRGPAGTYRWAVRATPASDGGAYTLCILHP